jgi:hypothetical protein
MNEPASDVEREAQQPKNEENDDNRPNNSSHNHLMSPWRKRA